MLAGMSLQRLPQPGGLGGEVQQHGLELGHAEEPHLAVEGPDSEVLAVALWRRSHRPLWPT